MAFNLQHLARKVASIGPNRKITAAALRFLPHKARHRIQRWLSLQPSEWSGHIHSPDSGSCGFLQNKSTIDISKARAQLGYDSTFSLEEGMILTAHFLKQG